MGGGKGGGGGGDQTVTVRYAGYIESKHKDFLNLEWSYVQSEVGDSPFANFSEVEVDDAFFGVGYTVASFPAYYDMFGKFQAGLDIESLFQQIFADTVESPVVADLVAAESVLMDDDIDANSRPRFLLGSRDTNSVMSSSFVIGNAIIEDAKVKALSKFSAELKYKLIPVAVERWVKHLEWNQRVVATYGQVIALYYGTKMNMTNFNYETLAKDKLWPFSVLEYMRAGLGALQGATTSKATDNTPAWQKYLSDALTIVGIASIL